MKRYIFIAFVLLCGIVMLHAQPQKMSYQAVVRNSNNELVVNQQVGVRVSILEDSVNGPMIYRETHTPTTNVNGLITIMIGEGLHPYTNTLTDVKWGKHIHYLSVEIAPAGGTNYTISGTQQMVSVPYAFYSESAKYVDTAIYAVNATVATYADTSRISNFADTTRVADYAHNSGNAVTANYATSAGTATTATSALYADSTRISNHAIVSNSATYADSTLISNHALTAGAANTANSANTAIYADTAMFLMNAQNSDTAKFAYHSDTANYALNSSYSEIQVISICNDTIYLTGGTNSFVKLPTVNVPDSLSAYINNVGFLTSDSLPGNVSYFNNDIGYLTSDSLPSYISYFNNDLGYITSYIDSQQISLSGDTLKLERGGSVVLSPSCCALVDSLKEQVDTLINVINEKSDQIDTLINAVDNLNGALDSLNVTVDSLSDVLDSLNNVVSILGNVVCRPSVITNNIYAIYADTALGGGYVTSPCDDSIIVRGVCWGTSDSPDLSDSHTSDSSGIGNYVSKLTGLLYGETYYVRAYATNSFGTSYGNVQHFTTLNVPTVVTNPISSIKTLTAVSGGNVTNDGGVAVTERGICWSTSPIPTISDSHTSDSAGTGSYTSYLTGLGVSTKYFVRAYAKNSIGIGYGDTISFTTPSCPATMTDVENNYYATIVFGKQCWMKENLRVTQYASGTTIALGSSSSTSVAYRYNPCNNSADSVAKHGYLYNWIAVMGGATQSSSNPSGVQGICPTGWHVPSEDEWIQLVNYVGSQSQYVCGSTATYIAKSLATKAGWNTSTVTCSVGENPGDNNSLGFDVMPSGRFFTSSDSYGQLCSYWTTTDATSVGYPDRAFNRRFRYDYTDIHRFNSTFNYGFSVRCVKD